MDFHPHLTPTPHQTPSQNSSLLPPNYLGLFSDSQQLLLVLLLLMAISQKLYQILLCVLGGRYSKSLSLCPYLPTHA